VSRIHCRLEANEETLEVIDLESTNGVYVNGERVETAHLIPGDRLRVGRVELQVGRTA
jgi:pSer/pThr/pTyr-binding forkhead associated (FHA) protein